VREQSIDVMLQFESVADYWEPFLLGQGPAGAYIRSLSRDKLHGLGTEVKRHLATPGDRGPIELPARAWGVRGIVPNVR
jgi:hypothetical protein